MRPGVCHVSSSPVNHVCSLPGNQISENYATERLDSLAEDNLLNVNTFKEFTKVPNKLTKPNPFGVHVTRATAPVPAICNVVQCGAVCSVCAVCCSVIQSVAMCCSVLQCVAVCCSVLQCAAVCCSVLQCVAVCCGVRCRVLHKIQTASTHDDCKFKVNLSLQSKQYEMKYNITILLLNTVHRPIVSQP